MSYKKLISALLIGAIIVLSLCGCSAKTVSTSEADSDELFTSRDLEGTYDESQAQHLSLSDESVTITTEGVYIIDGSLSDGQIIVDAEDAKIQLVLNGVIISSDNSAAIYVKEADKVFITLADTSANELKTVGEFEADGDINVDGVIFSKADLTLNGSGSLTVTTSYGNGIVSKDDLKITGGSYEISCSKHALESNDLFAIADGTVDVKESKEGIESKEIYITGGSLSILASDDGINASDDSSTAGEFAAQEGVLLSVSGGTVYINCDGDGIDSNGDISISGGSIVVEGPQNGANGALDYNGSAEISGGTILAIGSSGMAMNFSDASQGSILVNFNASYSGETITITDSDSNIIYTYKSSKTINSVLFSSEDLKKGETYTVSIGDQYQTVTLDSYIYGSSNGMGMGHMR